MALQGIRSFYGCITHPNPASEAFHRKLGFRELAIFPQAGYKQGRWLDVLWCCLPLGAKEDAPAPLCPFASLAPGQVAGILAEANRELNTQRIL